jgi:hypothetical protein
MFHKIGPWLPDCAVGLGHPVVVVILVLYVKEALLYILLGPVY